MDFPEEGYDLLGRLVSDLVSGRYDLLEEDGRSGRCTGNELRIAVERYGETLSDMSNTEIRQAEIYYTHEDIDLMWFIELDLKTRESEVSDLTLSCALKFSNMQDYTIEINDLRVL